MKNITTRYSIEPRDIIYVKGYGFLSFAKNIVKHLSHKYGQNFLDSAKKSTTDAIKTASKRAIQKTVEATDDLVGNKAADKITSVLKKSAKDLQNTETEEEDVKKTTPNKRYISPEERQQIIDEFRLIPKRMSSFRNYWWINVNTKKDTYLQERQQIINELRLV